MSIKSLTYRLSMLMAVCALLFSSCGGDDEVVIDEVEGINVADGIYMSATGVDPVASQVLTAEMVEDDGFASQTRDGFITSHVYLAAGDYNMYQITSKEIAATFGGTVETLEASPDNCGNKDYMLVTAVADGPAIAVATAGLYKVTYDAMTGEALLYRIDQPNIIGSATPNGWGGDTNFPAATASADGATWTATDVVLRPGEMKVRFNCGWTINRRTSDEWTADVGYQMFTNFGGTTDNLVPGGSNIPVADGADGKYTVEVKWTPADQWEMSLTLTEALDPISFVPDDNQWAVVGDAIADDGWDNDADMNYEGLTGTTYTWKVDDLTLRADKAFKFRTNDSWDNNIGWGQLTLDGDTADFSDDGGNIKVAAEGSYNIVLTTSDEGETYTATFTKL